MGSERAMTMSTAEAGNEPRPGLPRALGVGASFGRARPLSPGARRSGWSAFHSLEAPDDEGGRWPRGDGDRRRANHAGGMPPSPAEARRAAAALERAPGGDVRRGTAPGGSRVRGSQERSLATHPVRAARDHGPYLRQRTVWSNLRVLVETVLVASGLLRRPATTMEDVLAAVMPVSSSRRQS
jgi:hypothetical protein